MLIYFNTGDKSKKKRKTMEDDEEEEKVSRSTKLLGKCGEISDLSSDIMMIEGTDILE